MIIGIVGISSYAIAEEVLVGYPQKILDWVSFGCFISFVITLFL